MQSAAELSINTAAPMTPNKLRDRPLINWSKYAGILLLLGVLTAGGVFWIKNRLTKHEFTADSTVKQFIIGNDVLDVPLNMTRFASQRDQAVLTQADLFMYWVDGSGFREANRRVFLTPEGTKDLIFLTLSDRRMDFDMNDRLEPIYSKLLSGAKQAGPADLVLHEFRTGSGYDGEELVVSASGQPLWVARCQMAETMESPICLRDIFAGTGLSLRYRFSRSLLPYWREIEQLVIAKRSQILASGGGRGGT
ncbi:MAG: hypothetical protein ABJM29_05410 [Rhizobiaceae bacterium]